MSKEDDERFWNYILFRLPFTNKEVEESWPILGVFILLGLCVVIAFGLYK